MDSEIDYKDFFIEKLIQLNGFKVGKFVLKSGKVSPYYIDLRPFICNINACNNIVNEFINETSNICKTRYNFKVCGVPYGAVPLATIYANKSKLNLIMLRKEAKQHGTENLIEGIYKKGDNVILFEDVISTGGSVIDTINKLKEAGLKINIVCCVVDRELGGVRKIKRMNINVVCLYTISEILKMLFIKMRITSTQYSNCLAWTNIEKYLTKRISYMDRMTKDDSVKNRLLQLMLKKESNLCISADYDNMEKILWLAETIGPHIVVMKTHLDIVHNYNDEWMSKLRSAADRMGFLLFEDRKLCDIGVTMKKQLARYSKWIDLVNFHPICGSEAINVALEGTGIGGILVSQLSNSGAMTNFSYAEECSQLVYKSKEIIGFISQQKLKNWYLHFTPGVRIGKKNDGADQQYRTPEEAIMSGADLIIVGRGITEADDVGKAALMYKERGWQAYLKDC